MPSTQREAASTWGLLRLNQASSAMGCAAQVDWQVIG